MAITRKTWYGLAREATPGTAAATPTFYLPKKGVLKLDHKPEYSTEERGTRDTNYQVVYTTRKGTADLKGNYYNDTTPYLLLGILGQEEATQPEATHAPTVYQHLITPADTPPAFTLFKSYDTQIYQMSYTCFEKLSLKFQAEGKLLEVDVSCTGMAPVPYTGPALTPAFSTVRPFAGYQAAIQLGGTSTIDITEFGLEITNKLAPWFSASGSPDFSSVYFGERTVKLDYTARFNPANFDKFRNGTTDSLTITFTGDLITTYETTGYNQSLQITIPLFAYDSCEHDLGKENVLIKAKGTAMPSAAGPIVSCIVQNTTPHYGN